jgi:hypothetical protein
MKLIAMKCRLPSLRAAAACGLGAGEFRPRPTSAARGPIGRKPAHRLRIGIPVARVPPSGTCGMQRRPN